jgi:membrane protease YdiL (CAAX protease family)
MRSPALFFLLVLALSAPLWYIDALGANRILPGLPLSAVMVVCPLVASMILVARDHGVAGVTQHLAQSFDYRRIAHKGWFLPILLLMPAIALLAYVVMRVFDLPLPAAPVSLSILPGLFALFFVAGLAEELGWSGYAIDPLQARWGALGASLLLGVVWAAWHLVPLLQVGRAPQWIAWWSLGTIATRVLHTWLYNNTGKSVFGAAVFHAMTNVSWQLFPNQGSHYDPRIFGTILATAAALVTLVWGARRLRRAAKE